MLDLHPTAKSWDQTDPGDVLAVIGEYHDLLVALRLRKEALGFSHEQIDERTGLNRGHFDKIFGPRRKCNLGPLSFGLCLAALGVKVVLVADQTPPPPVRVKDHRQDRHPLVSPHLPPRDDGSHPTIPA
jgi:hypothetical protein